MASRNDNPLEQIGGFFEALFGACSGEDRKVDKKKDEIGQVSSKLKPDNRGNILENLFSAFAHDENELKRGMNDLSQMDEMVRNKEGGMGSGISQATKYLSGQEPPGFFTDSVNMLTGETPKYAFPLSQEQRDKTVKNLRKYSQENFSNDTFELRKKAGSIADKLEENGYSGYKYQSLAGAADASGLSKEKLQDLSNYLNKSIASEQAKDLAGDLRRSSSNLQLGIGSSGSGLINNNLQPQSDPLRPFPNSFGGGTTRPTDVLRSATGVHTSRLLARRGDQAEVRGGPNSSKVR
jgi:hypothetical protein